MSALSILCAACLFPTAALYSGNAAWEELAGPDSVTHLVGNGGLTAGFNPGGRITSCRWPSPGYSDQIAYWAVARALPAGGAAPWHGAMFAVRTAASIYWLDGAAHSLTQTYAHGPVPVIETHGVLYENGPAFLQRAFVHPRDDLLVLRLELRGVTVPPQIFWFQNFSPCTRRIPEWPIADGLLDNLNDFAAFATPDDASVYHLRPAGPGAQEWKKAADLAAQNASPAAWETFEKGVWIRASSPHPVLAARCGVDGAPGAPWATITSGAFTGATAAVGQCQSALKLTPVPLPGEPGGYAAVVYIAFGETRAAADDILARAMQQKDTALLDETTSHWRDWMQAAFPGIDGQEQRNALCAPLLILALSRDRNTDAVVRAPLTQPPLALVSAQQAAWMALALDYAGQRDAAERLTRFYAKALRRQSRPGMPAGSFPLALYADGDPAAPYLALAADASAWWVSMAWRHAGFLEDAPRREYLSALWSEVVLAADFLAAWKAPGTGEPLPSFHLDALRDTRSMDYLLKVYMGIECALRITRALNRPIDQEWQARQRELDALLRFRIRDQQAPWMVDPVLPVWLKAVVSESHPLWTAQAECNGRRDAMGAFGFPEDGPLPGATFPDAYRAALEIAAVCEGLTQTETPRMLKHDVNASTP